MKKLTLVAALLLAVAQLQAQELSLFEPVETDAAQDQQQQPCLPRQSDRSELNSHPPGSTWIVTPGPNGL
jgi:hypothetical protein